MTLHDDLQTALGSSYTIERELGGGGMSRLFVGEESALGRKVAVKVLAPELAAGVSAERFQREIKLAAQLQHPNIVPVLTTGVAAGLPYYTMPFVDGHSLRGRLERNPGVPIVEALAILRDVARALAYAHDHGIVHRDIKPDNILLADEAAVVTDFGIAKALSAARTNAPGGTLTQVGTSLGTPAYMAPEQAAADPSANHLADIYSFGCVAYELLTGAPPFAHRQPHQLFAAHINEKPAPLLDRRPDCPVEIANLITRCLEKNPADRPQSARELLHALDAGHTRTGPTPASYRPDKSGRKIVIGAIAGIAIFSAVAAIAFKESEHADIHSLAVLPFENIGGDTANAYFAEGMSDELTTELSKVEGLTLASRNSAFRFRGPTVDVKKVGKELDVGAVLEGTVRRAGDRLRLTAQLTNASNGKLLWTDSYEQKVQDVFALQDSITRSIVAALKVKLAADTAKTIVASTAQGTRNLAAYDLYLRGRYLWARRGEESLRKSIKLFEQAIRMDPQFARAHAGLALATSVLPMYVPMRSDSITPIGLAAGRRAVALDPNLSDAHLGLANILIYDFNWPEAEQHFKRALELEPGNATAHQWYGDDLYITGHAGDAIIELKRAVELDPLSAVMQKDLGFALAMGGRYSEAEEAARKSLELDPSFIWATSTLVSSLIGQGKLDEARQIVETHKGVGLYDQGVSLYLALHDREKADAEFRKADSAMKPVKVGFEYLRARLHAAAGHTDSALYWLDRSIELKDGNIFAGSPSCDLEFKPFQSNPRYRNALRRIGAVPCQMEPSAAGSR